MPTLHSARHDALRNALYHTARRRKLEALDRVGSFLVILLGAGAATEIASVCHPLLPKILAVATATIGALQLVFGYGSRARDHEFLQRRYYDLLAEMEEFGAPAEIDDDNPQLKAWCAAMARIAGDEPPTRLLESAQASNAASASLGVEREEFLRIPIWLMIAGHLFAFDGWRLEKIKEYEARKSTSG